MSDRFEQLARDLAEAWRNGSTIPLPRAGQGPATRADAYAIQDRMAELIGAKVAGWKVGATVRAVQVFEGHDGPLPGRVFADRLFESAAKIPAHLFKGAKVECEFAFRLTRDLPKGTTPVTQDEIAPSLTFHPAFELAASRYAAGTGERAATTFDGIADNGSGGAAVLGAAVNDWQGLPFSTMEIDARITTAHRSRSTPWSLPARSSRNRRRNISDCGRGVELPAGTCVLTARSRWPTPVRKGQP